MLNKIIRLGLQARLLVVLALIAFLAGSFLVLPKLNLDAFPDVTNIQVQVNTEARGLAAEEVEQLITFPIESVMYALPDVEEVRSISKTGLSVVTVAFKEGTDIYFARQLVFERLQMAKERIPKAAGTPAIGPNTSGLGQIYQYILSSEAGSQYDSSRLRSLNDWVVKLLLMPIEGVTDVLSFGGKVRQFQVQLSSQQLLAHNLSVNDVAEAIERNNRNAGGWYLDRGAEQLVIRGVGWINKGSEGLNDISNIPLKTIDGIPVRVSDVGRVAFGSEIRQGAVTMATRDQQGNLVMMGEVVAGIVLKRMGANTKSTIDSIKARLPVIQAALPKGVTIEPFYDQSNLIKQAVSTVTTALVQAFVLIVVILMLFLVNFRSTFLVLLSIPVSIGLSLLVMAYWNVSANLMSLGGLAIAIGMLVDGSVVMVDNIFKKLTEDKLQDGHQGVDYKQLISEAAQEVGRPIFFAGIIVITVFAPLFTLEGVEGKLFQPMAFSIVIAMLGALLSSLLLVPPLASYLFERGVGVKTSPVMPPLIKLYKKLLMGAFRFRSLVIAGAFVLFIGAIVLFKITGTEFVPELEEGTLNIRVTLAPSSSLSTSLEVAQKLERQLMTFPEVIYTSSRIGRAEIGGDPEPVSNIEIYVGLQPVSEWNSAPDRRSLQALMEKKMAQHPGLLFSFSQPIATRVDELLSGVKAQLAIKLFGPDLNILSKKGKEIERLARKVKGTNDVELEQVVGESQLVIRPDRKALARYDISVNQVMELIADAIGGREAGQVINGNERYDIYVRLKESERSSVNKIRRLILESPSGAWVQLDDVATVEIESGPPQIRRDDVQRRIVIQSNVEGRDMGGLVDELRERIRSEVDLPAGYSVVFGGQYESQQRAQARLMIVVPASLGLIFILLYFAFNSMGQALLIMVNVPLALIGGITSLYLSGLYLSVPGSIGFITLLGVAVLNGVVMVSAINSRLNQSSKTEEAIFEGAISRLRPVLMTAITSALGLIPLILSSGVGSEIQRPLATVVVGGLLSSTLLTLFILPLLYKFFSRSVIKRSRSL
ncbi:MAG: CusA/CzcA family heavy metal efflux RND transporter [Gammaproteobacteria bacterium]|nr:MAG: CusA/CzcA family heavy metal efflux RND transporter [Gammaproteobacteria bacterium]